MSENHDYTGLVRTPSSMAWLIRHRAKIKGQLDRAKGQQDSLPDRIKGLEDDLAAIDAVIPLHEVKVDAELIQSRFGKPRHCRAHQSGGQAAGCLDQGRLGSSPPRAGNQGHGHVVARDGRPRSCGTSSVVLIA